jgi:hypothetical protein
MTKIQKLYGNGCSFTNDNHANLTLRVPLYLDHIGHKFNLKITKNAGLPGSCNRRIIRTTLRDALNFDSSTLVLVQLTQLQRSEKAYTPGQQNAWKMENSYEEYHESIKAGSIEPLNAKYFENYARYYDECAAVTDLAADLIMLTAFLQHKQIPYFIFPYSTMINTNTLLKVKDNRLQVELAKNSNVMNILTDCLLNKLGDGKWFYDADETMHSLGHLNGEGHKATANLLQQILSNLYVELKQ